MIALKGKVCGARLGTSKKGKDYCTLSVMYSDPSDEGYTGYKVAEVFVDDDMLGAVGKQAGKLIDKAVELNKFYFPETKQSVLKLVKISL